VPSSATDRTDVAPDADRFKSLGLSLLDEAVHTTDPVARERLRAEALAALATARRLRHTNERT
jgi:hypothetical protein